MKKIGRQVHLISASDKNPRNGEGSFIELENGVIMFGYTEFIGDSREDEGNAQISVIYSEDNGETWGNKRTIFTRPEGTVNIMCLSFLRMENGDIGAFYIIKFADGTDTIVLRRSSDDGETWSEPVDCLSCIKKRDYYILNNDRAVRLRSGRILLPLARHTIYENPDIFMPGELCFVYSDDDGISWHKTEHELKLPFSDDKNGLQEPGVYEMTDGKIWCYIRTGVGFQFQCFSDDSGITWSAPQPNIFFSSPCSPMLVTDCKNLTLAIFNPIPEHILRDDEKEFWGRTPYVMAVSKDKGKTFTQEDLYYLEDDLNNGYCYPAVFEGDDYFLVAYYHSNNTDCCLNSTKITKIMFDEIV